MVYDLTGRLHSVQVRHGDVHHHYIRLFGSRQGDGFTPVGGFAHDGQIGLALQQQPQAVAHHRVIVGQKNTDGG